MRPDIENLKRFVEQPQPTFRKEWSAVSLFAGAGLSDLGYRLAGFEFFVHVEENIRRAHFGEDNFSESDWIIGDVRKLVSEVSQKFKCATKEPLDLLVATPPCQGMSSSNPSRGRRNTKEAKSQEDKNRLILALLPVAEELRPKIIVAENVRPVLTLQVDYQGKFTRIIDHLENGLSDYKLFHGVINMADYGIPQIRKRAIIVGIRNDQPILNDLLTEGLLPWPKPTHSQHSSTELREWITVKEWFNAMEYESLDARNLDTACGEHSLHFVPHYNPARYLLVKDIPAYSGQSAYQNDTCPECKTSPVAEQVILCPKCGAVMRNRPFMIEDGIPRLIKGFQSSYRRMDPDRPAYTITTNTSHIGSDFKIHPWEHRVLSILECADLQTVPRFFKWSRAFAEKTPYLIRNVVGEALPTFFTHKHGQVLDRLLSRDHLRDQNLTQILMPRLMAQHPQ